MRVKSPGRRLTWLAGTLSLVFVAFVSCLDAVCWFEVSYVERLVFAVFYLASPIAIGLRYRGVRVIVATSLLWMLVVLPQVRWTYAKSFFLDARRIKTGMAVSQVRQIMRPYLEVRDGMAYDGDGLVSYRPTMDEQRWPPWLDDSLDSMIFIYDVRGWTDHCEVWLDRQQRVRRIEIEKD